MQKQPRWASCDSRHREHSACPGIWYSYNPHFPHFLHFPARQNEVYIYDKWKQNDITKEAYRYRIIANFNMKKLPSPGKGGERKKKLTFKPIQFPLNSLTPVPKPTHSPYLSLYSHTPPPHKLPPPNLNVS